MSTQSAPFELMYLDPATLQEGLLYSKMKRRQNKEESNQRALRHEQRRRKFLRQQDTNQQKLAKDFFDKEVVGQLLNKASCEKYEDELRDVVLSYKQLIPTNRKNRQLQIDIFSAADRTFDRSWEMVEANRELKWTLFLDTNSQSSRRTRLVNAHTEAVRYDTVSFIQGFLGELVDTVIWVATCREIAQFDHTVQSDNAEAMAMQLTAKGVMASDEPALPKLLFDDLKTLLASDLPSPPELTNLRPMLVSSMLVPFNIAARPNLAKKEWLLHQVFTSQFVFDALSAPSEENSSTPRVTTFSDYLSSSDWSRFIEERNSRAAQLPTASHPSGVRPEGNHKDEGIAAQSSRVSGNCDALLTPNWVLTEHPQHLLGEAITHIRTTLKPIPPLPDALVPTSQCAFRGALFGISTLMKDKIAGFFQQFVPRLEIIRVEACVRSLLAQIPSSSSSDQAGAAEVDPLALELQAHLAAGRDIPDALYVQVIVQAVRRLPLEENNGFLLVDFPSTLEQLLLLLEAFSGIRYDGHRPQASDHVSALAPIRKVHETFDISRCGLDLLLCVDSTEAAVGAALRERLNARRNLYSGEIVYLEPDCRSVRGLQQVYDPSRPIHSVALQVTTAEQHCNRLIDFATSYNMLEKIAAKGEGEEKEEGRGEEEWVEWVQGIARRFVVEERLSEEYWVQEDERREERRRLARETEEREKEMREAEHVHEQVREVLVDEIVGSVAEKVSQETWEAETAAAAAALAPDGAPAASAAAGATAGTGDGAGGGNEADAPSPDTTPAPPPPPVLSPSTLPPALATALHPLWKLAEEHSQSAGISYYNAMRDVRCQMIQRRRLCLDSVLSCMMRLDDRQDVFNVFRTDFNSLEEDLRFDPDAIAWLHLRTLQLRNELSKLCEERHKEHQELLQHLQGDNNVQVFIYRCYCEASFFLQSEWNRFYTSLHVLLDVAKAMQGYNMRDRIRNDLEKLLPIVLEGYSGPPEAPPKPAISTGGNGKDGKAKKEEKKGKDSGAAPGVFVPFREVLAPWSIHAHHMAGAIPTARVKEEPAPDPKAKDKKEKKDKKGAAAEEVSSGNPMLDVETAIRSDLQKWKQGSFVLSRELFEGDEALCKAIEAAIWFEADKLEGTVALIHDYSTQQAQWLEACETQCMQLLQAHIHDRYLHELLAGEKVIDLVEVAIANAEPLEMLWLVSPDACTPVVPSSLWKKWRILVPFVWLKQYEKGLQRRFKKYLSRQAGMAGVVSAAITAASVLPDLTSSRFNLDDPWSDSESDDPDGNGGGSGKSSNPSSRPNSKHGNRLVNKFRSNSANKRPASKDKRRPTSAQSSGSGTSTPTAYSAGFGNTRSSGEGFTNALRGIGGVNAVGRPVSGPEDALARETAKYLEERTLLEAKLKAQRAGREIEFRELGMSPSAAKLAAFNELLLDEQHQLADLEAAWRPILSRARPGSGGTSRGGLIRRSGGQSTH